MRYVALDVGSTWIKCFLLDTDALAAREIGRRAFPAAQGNSRGRYEVDADALCGLCRGLVDGALNGASDAAGVFIGTLMHGFLLTGQDNRPLTGYVSWQDAASLESASDGNTYLSCLEALLPAEVFMRTGAPLRSKLAIANLYARLRTGLALPAGARFHTLGGYLNMQLGGAYACHLSSAASTGLCDARSGQWMPELFGSIGAESLYLPAVERQVRPIGAYRYRGRDFALYPDFGDHQVCALGSLAEPESDVNVNIGTGGMVGLITDTFARGCENRPLLEKYFIRTRTGLPAGRHLQDTVVALLNEARLCGEEPQESYIWEEITRSPLKDDSILSMYAEYGRAYADAVASLGGGHVGKLVYSGGAALRNPPLRRAIEDACGLPGHIPEADAVSLGMLRLALLSEGGNLKSTRARLARV